MWPGRTGTNGSIETACMLTSKNLLSCCNWPFSVRNCVTTLMASATILALSVFGVLLGSKALASSIKLQTEWMILSSPKICFSTLLPIACPDQFMLQNMARHPLQACCASLSPNVLYRTGLHWASSLRTSLICTSDDSRTLPIIETNSSLSLSCSLGGSPFYWHCLIKATCRPWIVLWHGKALSNQASPQIPLPGHHRDLLALSHQTQQLGRSSLCTHYRWLAVSALNSLTTLPWLTAAQRDADLSKVRWCSLVVDQQECNKEHRRIRRHDMGMKISR